MIIRKSRWLSDPKGVAVATHLFVTLAGSDSLLIHLRMIIPGSFAAPNVE